ncbi:hypothetical protein A0256_13080 [Mucilaginibacter sp. PAMC 26640]|nr:hypothetical protein A0256_13080 [Mucilaginibacter sp. PAMC 26640]
MSCVMAKFNLMFLRYVLLSLIFNISAAGLYAQSKNNLRYVNPFIGTAKSGVLTRWGGDGGTYPGAVAPSGMIQISPETRVSGARGYNFADSSVYYFSCTGHNSGFPEGSSGRLFVMPVLGNTEFKAGVSASHFLHQDEVARPGYYKVTFANGITTEAAAATRSGILRFTFPTGSEPQIFIGNTGAMKIVSNKTLHGASLNAVYNFSEEFIEKRKEADGYLFTFKAFTGGHKSIDLKLSTSTVSFEGAQNNLDKELGGRTLDEIAKHTAGNWAAQLSTIAVDDPNANNKTIFYTALYHSLLIPYVISDADGSYRGSDGYLHRASGTNQYGGFSPWDTFRSLHPLLSLLYPQKQTDIILSMLDVYKQTGHLPTESMTGNHAIPIIVDAYFKGITAFDKELAYKAMKSNIVDSPFVQNDMAIYHSMGYVPYTRSESVTRTVEYAYDDWSLAQYAKEVMNNKADYRLLERRGYNYRNIFYPNSLFLLPRLNDAFKTEPGMSGYKEGEKWVYSYFVPHNARDLINLMGGNAAFAARLDSALNNQVILYDNETVIHLPYLFNTAARPDLTQKWIRNIMLNRYKNSPDGLPGNDDLGAMSSAYVFNALGFFPVCPGIPQYAIGTPLFKSVQLNLPSHKTWRIESQQPSTGNQIAALNINGIANRQLVIAHEDIVKGGVMRFIMGKNKRRTDEPLILSVTKNKSSIRILKSRIKKQQLRPDEPMWVYFSLTNTGAAGTKRISLTMDGQEIAMMNCLVKEGETQADSISCRLYKLGKANIALNYRPVGEVKVIESRSPVQSPFAVSALQISSLVKLNESQKVSFVVKNLTGRKRDLSLPVYVNDSLVYTNRLSLAPGESKTATYGFRETNTGLKTLKIGSLSAKYSVYNTDAGSLLLDLSTMRKDNSGKLKDHSGLDNNATVMTPMDIQKNVQGRLMFGDSLYLDVPPSGSLDNLGKTITMMAWVYPRATEKGLVDMVTKGDSHVLQTTDNKTLTFFAGGWGRGDCTVPLPQNWKDHWHHIAGVCNGRTLFVYIDGKLSGKSAVEGEVNLSGNNHWQIGRNEEFPSERIFHGYIDNIRVYGNALSDIEIAEIFKSSSDIQ